MRNFDLKKFECGHPTRTISGTPVTFVAILPENIPARLLVEVGGLMTNYYLNGSYLESPHQSDGDLILDGYIN